MSLELLIICLAIFGLSSLVIFYPVLKRNQKRQADFLQKLDKLYFEKERLLQNLEDLELDLQLQKISEGDSIALKNSLLAEASTIYNEIEKLENESPFLKEINRDLALLERELNP